MLDFYLWATLAKFLMIKFYQVLNIEKKLNRFAKYLAIFILLFDPVFDLASVTSCEGLFYLQHYSLILELHGAKSRETWVFR